VDGTRSRDDGRRPAIPTVVLIVAIVIAVGAVSGLIYLLFKTTTGPGQTLRHYYEDVAAGDCDAAYGLLSTRLRKEVSHESFCVSVRHAERSGVPSEVKIKSVTGYGEPPARYARVVVQERGRAATGSPVTWKMIREGSSWFIATFETTRCASEQGGCQPPLG
jgi:hypothetical protein